MSSSKKKKKLWIILGTILVIIAAIVVTVSVIANQNVKAMHQVIDRAVNTIKTNHTLTKIEEEEYNEITVYGIMKFHVDHYWIEDIGNLSIMTVNMGVMQMATFVITPNSKNLPLMSADYMYILSNRKAYLEFYDLVENKNSLYLEYLDKLENIQSSYSNLNDIETSEAWYEYLLTVTSYKEGSSGDDEQLSSMLNESLGMYLEMADASPEMTSDEINSKREITLDYTDGLIEKGGISTDVFKSALGEEKTKHFFDNVFFGTALF